MSITITPQTVAPKIAPISGVMLQAATPNHKSIVGYLPVLLNAPEAVVPIEVKPVPKKSEFLHSEIFERNGLSLNKAIVSDRLKTSRYATDAFFSRLPKSVSEFLTRYLQVPMPEAYQRKGLKAMSALEQNVHAFMKLPEQQEGNRFREFAQIDFSKPNGVKNALDFEVQSIGKVSDLKLGETVRKLFELPKELKHMAQNLSAESRERAERLDPSLKAKRIQQHQNLLSDPTVTKWAIKDSQQSIVGTASIMPFNKLPQIKKLATDNKTTVPPGHALAAFSLKPEVPQHELSKALVANIIRDARQKGHENLWLGLPKNAPLADHLALLHKATPSTVDKLKQFKFLTPNNAQALLSSYNMLNYQLLHIKL